MIDNDTSRFAGWVLGLSVPFYVVGTLASGDAVEALPITAVVAVVPAVAAAIVTRRGRRSVRRLLARGLRAPHARAGRWLVASVATMPVVVIAAHAIAVPHDPEPGGVGLAAVAAVVVLALIASYGEELGWTAFATRRVLRDHSVLSTALLVAGLWAAWHFIPFVHTNNSWSWVAWQTAFTAVFRVLITAFYVLSGGSALVAVLLHASYNVAWTVLSAIWAPYDPAVMTVATAAVAAGAVIAARRVRRSVPDASTLVDVTA